MASRRLVALALLVLAAAESARGDESSRVDLGGRLVAVAAPQAGGPLFVLVRPEDRGDEPGRQMTISPGGVEVAPLPGPEAGPDAPRRLLRIGANGAAAETLAEGVGGWTKALAALDLGAGPQLVAGGLGRLASLGPLAAPDGVERTLLEHPGFDLRSLHPSPLRVGVERDVAAAETGALRIWQGGPDGLELAADLGLPFNVERRGAGLRLSGPPVVELPRDATGRRRFAVGPEARGGARLRVLLVSETAEGWTTVECWAAPPAPEQVEESWIADAGDGPLLVARTQGAVEVNAFEDQLWRIFRLVPDRTRTGRRPSLAVSVDSKRWHDNRALVADADGDGHVDLLVARPEGVTGGDLVVERYGGLGNGGFDPRPRRVDLDDPPHDFRWVADIDGSGRPGLVGLVERDLVVWRTAREGRRPLESAPLLRLPIDAATGADRPSLELLGELPRSAAPPEILLVVTPKEGGSTLVRARVPNR